MSLLAALRREPKIPTGVGHTLPTSMSVREAPVRKPQWGAVGHPHRDICGWQRSDMDVPANLRKSGCSVFTRNQLRVLAGSKVDLYAALKMLQLLFLCIAAGRRANAS